VGAVALALAFAFSWDAQPPPRVWCVGDSITHFYAPVLATREPRWTVLDLGRGGERSDRGLVRLAGLLAANPAPDVVVIAFGANDVATRVMDGDRRYGGVTAARNVREMARLVRAAGAVPIVALPSGAPPPDDGDDATARRNLRALRREFTALRRALRRERPRVDLRLLHRARFVDALHPRPVGVELIARRVARAVRRVPPPAGAAARGA
jgi:lysophospholipase L1-like esterase